MTGPFQRQPCGKGSLVPRGPGSSTEGDSEAAPGARGRGELALGGAPRAGVGRGTREERRAPGAGTRQPAHGGPLERPGAPPAGKKRAGSPGAGGRCQLEPAAGRVRTRGRPPWGPFPPGQKRSLRGSGAATRGGGAPTAGPEDGRPGRLMLVVAPASRHCHPLQKQPKSHRLPQERAPVAPANSLPMRPLPQPRRRRARPGERPHPSPTPRPALPAPAVPAPPPPITSSRRPLAHAPHTPPTRPSAAGTTSPPRSSSPPAPAREGRRRRGTHPLSLARPRAAPALVLSVGPRAAAARAATEAG
ncbi:uncharacterized protein LOC112869504 [Puma concolor]|uniref:Uncharacterized protein LOC112869504 n=1 Tax=Puma concolor TaxID=9696 RepID=A0A6P6IKV2_PUMCO|nr:uncharacterized protein LOC112869504 [Puma concolor]